MARSENCSCTDNFTCGFCCRNAKPPVYTSSQDIWSVRRCAERERERIASYPRVYSIAEMFNTTHNQAWFAIKCNGEFWNVKEDSSDNPIRYNSRIDALGDLNKFVPLTKDNAT